MEPVIDHIQITVRDMNVSVPFYDELMPLLGFDPGLRSEGKVEAHELHVVEYVHPLLTFAINSPRSAVAGELIHRRRPGSLHHLAFKATSREMVDALAEQLRRIGINPVHGPGAFPQHGEDYYAVFFKDPDGIKFELVHDGSKPGPS